MLPTKKSEPITELERVTMVIYGPPKIGKSTFCSRFENAFFIATEPGLNHLNTYNVLCKKWTDIEEVVYDLETENHNFSPIVIDTVDNAWEMCINAVCDSHNVTNITDIPYGRGYKEAESLFKNVINRIVQLDIGLIFTSHAVSDMVEQTDGTEIKKFVPSIPEKCRKIILPLVDVIGFASIQTGVDSEGNRVESRVLRIKPSTLWEAGDRTGKLPDVLPLSQPAYIKAFTKG